MHHLAMDEQRLLTASARLSSFAHCSYMLINLAVVRLHASNVVLKVGFDDKNKSILQIKDNGNWPKKFIDSLKVTFKQRVFKKLEENLLLELDTSFPSVKHVICLGQSVHIVWPVFGDSANRSYSLKFKEGQLTAFEFLPRRDKTNCITIQNLFWNIPVRQKCRDVADEWRCLSKMLEDLSVCHFMANLKLCEAAVDDVTQIKELLSFGPFACRLDAFLGLKSLLNRSDFLPIRFCKEKSYLLNGFVSMKRLGESHLHIPKLVVVNKVPVAHSSFIYQLTDSLLSKYYIGGGDGQNAVSRTFSFVLVFKIPAQECLFDWHESGFSLQLQNNSKFRRFLKSCISSFVRQHIQQTSSNPTVALKSTRREFTKNTPRQFSGRWEHSGDDNLDNSSDVASTSDKDSSSQPKLTKQTSSPSPDSDAQLSSDDDSQDDGESANPELEQQQNNNYCRIELPSFFPAPLLPVLNMTDCSKLVPVDANFTVSRDDLSLMQVIGQFSDSFIICLLDRAACEPSALNLKVVVAIDQHAAHERIRLDRLLQREPQCTVLPPSVKIADLPLRPADVFSFEYIKWEKLGFRLQRRNDSATVIEIPDVFFDIFDGDKVSVEKTALAALVSHSIVQILLKPSLYKRLFDIPAVIEAAKSASCHGAIKAGQPLAMSQCAGLIQALAECQDPFHCAHGRPSIAPLAKMP